MLGLVIYFCETLFHTSSSWSGFHCSGWLHLLKGWDTAMSPAMNAEKMCTNFGCLKRSIFASLSLFLLLFMSD